MTVEAWVNSKNMNNSGHIVNQGGGWNDPGFSLFWLSKNIRIELNKNGQHIIVDNPAPSDDEWHHLAFTWENKSQEIITYIDGEKQANTKKFTGPIGIPTQPLNIGRNARHDYYFMGQITEVRIWDKARSQEEIKQDMNHRLIGKEESLIAYFPLSGDALDHSSNSNNGTIHGATWTQDNVDFCEALKANVEIAEIVYHGHVKRTQSDEYIEITNSGNTAADLSNWKVISNGKNQIFAFPEGTSLAVGKMIRVYTNEIHQESGGFSFGSKTAIWNDKGDMGKLLDSEGKEVSTFSYGNQPKNDNSVDSIKAKLGVSGLTVNITETDIKQLMTPQTKVNFLDAFSAAMKSFIEDGSLSESPLYILQELPEEYGLSDSPNEQEINTKVKELLNACGVELITDAEDPADEWAGKVMCDETGESYGTNSYWIFKLSPSQFTDLNYAVVDKVGVQPTINWGFS
ncbi:LamG-like jellyroll fold domain-containing protein [Crocosphaera sp. Alani8]|uniref:LamG-like jellyroll fold domain-containing protein n=1 Tax=Crocosphaera sp. Alani8 TaxID=3038952 RepID=UPI00313DAEE6